VSSTKVLSQYLVDLGGLAHAEATHQARHRLRVGLANTRRVAQLVALAICIGMGLALVIANVRSWELEDADAYWNAALRLRDGADLYPPLADAGAPDVYRYAPWLAWLWVPLTFLPKIVVQVGWSALLVAAIGIALAPLLRMRTMAAICLAALLGGLLVRTASTGNVHALLIAALVYGAPRRSGPIWVGVAASLKFVPLGYALVCAGRREWSRAAITIAVTAILLGPALLYDLTDYPTAAGDSLSLLSLAGPLPWAVVALTLAAAAVVLARTRFAWVAASTAVLAAIPRLDLYGLTYLLVGSDAPASKASVEQPDRLTAPRYYPRRSFTVAMVDGRVRSRPPNRAEPASLTPVMSAVIKTAHRPEPVDRPSIGHSQQLVVGSDVVTQRPEQVHLAPLAGHLAIEQEREEAGRSRLI
jgi:hypothetical protein